MKDNLILIGIAIPFIIVLIWILLGGVNKNPITVNPGLKLEGSAGSTTNQQTGLGSFKDDKCNISFNYPTSWVASKNKLPLPQPPLFQITFDEPQKGNVQAKNSLFSYICFDANKYSFDQFFNQSNPGGGETIKAGNLAWQRVGNFSYTTVNGKLLILQMFFTKFDINSDPNYETTFLSILKSFRVN